MNKQAEILILVCLLGLVSRSQVITVNQDGTSDATTIQAGIDMSQDGDTVLVWPGSYYENLLCQNKNITIASLELTTGETSYRYQTMIDGNFSGPCLKIRDCTIGVSVHGFTLEHGSGGYHGAISGGGLMVINSVAEIFNCLIQENIVSGYGGGIYIYHSDCFLSGTTICNNQTYSNGGGIMDLASLVRFDSMNLCNIYLNYAAEGTDYYKLGQENSVQIIADTFTITNPDYYYIFSFTGWGYPGNDITYSINTGKLEGVTQDLYVAPWGDNSNSGFNSSEPLKEISFALLKMQSDSISPDTIHMADGVYGPSSGEKFPLSLKAFTSIRGTSRENTILDGENVNNILRGIVYARDYQIRDLTIRNGSDLHNSNHYGAIDLLENDNSSFANLLFTGNHGQFSSCGNIHNSNNFSLHDVEFFQNYGGSALRIGHANTDTLFFDTVMLYNCYFRHNLPEYIHPDEGFGGALDFVGEAYGPNSDLITGYVYNSLFEDNVTKDYPFGAGSNSIGLGFGAVANIINCTFGYNISENHEGANIGVTYNSDLKVYNSIMYGNYPAEFYMYATDGDECSLAIYNSLVAGGEEDIRILSPWNEVYYDQSNIVTDPVWDTAGPWPYSLLEGSPCIDAGTLDLPPDINLPETDITGNPRIWGNSVDMGAYEYGPWVKVPDRNELLPVKESRQLMAYPNPFHNQTVITYQARKPGHLVIAVTDINGSALGTLLDCNTMAQMGRFTWDGTVSGSSGIPPGTYILRLTINDAIQESLKIIKE
jgi:hypothetical protein